jgi:hypothetical protein
MIAISTLSKFTIFLKKIGGLLNIAAGNKEKDKLERRENRQDLTLVEQLDKQHRERTLRIGVSEDLFSPRRGTADKTRSLPRRSYDIFGDELQTGQSKVSTRSETPIAFALAGLILGYFIGRRDF